MNELILSLYRFLFIPLFTLLYWLGSFFNSKMKQGWRARRDGLVLLKKQMDSYKSRTKRVLFHASSVGEWEQAIPIIELIKKDSPETVVIVSFFSPSGYNYMKQHPAVDIKCYLPIDSKKNAKAFLSIIRPQLVAISKFDIWPMHVKVAHEMGIKVVVTAGTLSSNSGRVKGLGGRVNKVVYPFIDHIFAISMEDARRFQLIFPFPERISVTSDTRFDRVYEKAMQSQTLPDVTIFKEKKGLKIVAASIWPADEKVVLPAIIRIAKEYPEVQVLLVPHELHEAHLKAIEDALTAEELRSERYTAFSEKGGTNEQFAIINTIGMLARIYRQTDVAYVGGSFSTGVHNVMEPAIFAQPVITGPVYQNSFEAIQLIEKGLAQSIATMEECYTAMKNYIDHAEKRVKDGQGSKAFIEENRGASRKTYEALKRLGYTNLV